MASSSSSWLGMAVPAGWLRFLGPLMDFAPSVLLFTSLAIVLTYYCYFYYFSGGGAAAGVGGRRNRRLASAGAPEGQGSSGTTKPSVSLTLNNTVLMSSAAPSGGSGGEATAAARHTPQFVAANVRPFRLLCEYTELYLICKVRDDAEEAALIKLLREAGAFEAGLKPHRVLACELESSVATLVRQLQPAVHIEESAAVAAQLLGKVPNIVKIAATPESEGIPFAGAVGNLLQMAGAPDSLLSESESGGGGGGGGRGGGKGEGGGRGGEG
eukprot:GHVU01017655.1.p1 GENE.GHVU01017655.1~~GHVU01017655.1.p1  ORF type:complete len:270 (-),score=74.53 GHVU01017655.1:367-1176(-)